jgi:hypothetical protein
MGSFIFHVTAVLNMIEAVRLRWQGFGAFSFCRPKDLGSEQSAWRRVGAKTGPGRGKGGGGRRATSWKPGQSGNPAGCPTGSRPRFAVLADKKAAEYSEPLINVLINAAATGDMAAWKIIASICLEAT